MGENLKKTSTTNEFARPLPMIVATLLLIGVFAFVSILL